MASSIRLRSCPLSGKSGSCGAWISRKMDFAVTGCNEEIGFETMNALAANGAHVLGLAWAPWRAPKMPAIRSGPRATLIENCCVINPILSIRFHAAMPRKSEVSSVTRRDRCQRGGEQSRRQALRTRYGVELQFLSNHIGHFSLVNQLLNLVRNGTGRIVIAKQQRKRHGSPLQRESCSTISTVIDFTIR